MNIAEDLEDYAVHLSKVFNPYKSNKRNTVFSLDMNQPNLM